MPEDTVINLESSPFNVNVAAIPGKSAGQIEIEVAPSVNLTDVPEVRIRQSGAVTDSLILMTYNGAADIYTGTLILSSTLPSSGIIEIEARDVSNHVLDTYRTFSFQSLVSSQDSSLISSDGVAELYIPAGNVSTGGIAEVTYDRTTGTPPDNLLVVGGPFNIVTSEGVSLVGVAGLTIAYLGPGSKYGRADLSSAQMYRWDKVTKGWQLVPSNIYDVRNSVTATIDQLGIYAVLAKRQYLVYLPTVLKK